MPIHFASARRADRSALARCLAVPRGMKAVNDNYGQGAEALIDNPLLRATLEHFAEHGLGAAFEARSRAETAVLAGDGASYRHWLAVCRMLDRRVADRRPRRAAPGTIRS